MKLRCRNGHDYDIEFPEPKRQECNHTGQKVRGVCIPCAMASPTSDPDPRCPECGEIPARILDQPTVRIRIIRGKPNYIPRPESEPGPC